MTRVQDGVSDGVAGRGPAHLAAGPLLPGLMMTVYFSPVRVIHLLKVPKYSKYSTKAPTLAYNGTFSLLEALTSASNE